MDFLIVGKNPRKSMIVTRIIDISGSLVSSQGMIDNIDAPRNILSERVMSFSPLVRANPKIANDITAVAAVTQAPAPASSLCCPKKAIVVNVAHISHVKAWGLVLPAKMSLK